MEDIKELLKTTNAMLEGHFLLSSGLHSDKYFQCAKLFQYPEKAQKAINIIANKINEDLLSKKIKIDILAGPAMGGIIAAWELGRQLSLPAVFTERDENGIMTLRRGFDLKEGQSVFIVEDVVTTGKSSFECASCLEKKGAVISGLACIIDRRKPDDSAFKWPFYSAIKVEAGSWSESECELCKQGLPLVKPGSRKII